MEIKNLIIIYIILILILSFTQAGDVNVGTYSVEELCTPVYKNVTEEKKILKTCIESINSSSSTKINSSYVLLANGSYHYETFFYWDCLDYIDYINHTNKQVGCNKIGKVKVGEVTVGKKGEWCRPIGDEICCCPNDRGGQYCVWWRRDLMDCKKVSSIETV